MSQLAKIDNEKRNLLSDLINITREVSTKYQGCKQLVTEEFVDIQNLLNLWEKVLSHGLKTSLFNNVQELFNSSSSGSMFWTFAHQHLTYDEQRRFTNFKNLWTDRGKTKALIRNALNEKCFERYILTWINAENINEFYENYALLRDEKSAILPKLASDISSILFAIKIDIPELNVSTAKTNFPKDEPIIETTASTSGKVNKANCKIRSIDDFEETVKPNEGAKTSSDLSELKFEANFIPKNEDFLVLPAKEMANTVDPAIKMSHQTASEYPSSTKPEPSALNLSIDPLSALIPSNFDRISISTESSSMSPSNFYDVKNDSDTVSSISSNDDENVAIKRPEQLKQQPTNSIANENLQHEHQLMIQKQKERISELEQQILDLTIENTRLRNLLNANKVNTLANFQISIPRAVLKKSKPKNYYIYEINLKTTAGEETWTIFKRYRDFYKLHKGLKKHHLQIKVLDFPPKKKIGNMDFDFVEDRRQRLQVYIRHVLQNLPELSQCESRQLLEAKCPFFKPQ